MESKPLSIEEHEDFLLESPVHDNGLSIRDQVLRFFALAWRRKWLILLGIVTGLVLGSISYVRAPQVFESTSELVLISKRPKLTGEADLDLNNDFGLAIHSEFIRSPEIIETAISDSDLDQLFSFRQTGNLVDSIRSGLTVKLISSADRSSVGIGRMKCYFRSANGFDSQQVLNALTSAYQAYLDETFNRLNRDTSDLLVSKIEETKEELRDLEQQELSLRREAPQLYVSVQRDSDKEEQASFHEVELANLERERLKLKARNNILVTRDEFISRALHDEETAAQLKDKIRQWQREDQVLETRTADVMEEALTERLLLLQNYGANHPMVVAAREKLAFMQQVTGQMPATALDSPEAYREHLESEMQQLGISTQAIQTRIEAQFEEVDRLSEQRLRKRQIERNIERAETTYDNFMEQLNAVDLSQDQGGVIARQISPADIGSLVAPKLINTLGLYMLASLGVVVALVYYIESDQRLKSVGDVRQLLGNSVFGYVPRLASVVDPSSSSLASELATFHAPSSPSAEAFRYIRSSLFFRSRDKTHQVIQLTSPESGDGKSTISGNLAIVLSQAGHKVLIIDADLRRPHLSSMFGRQKQTGLCELLSDPEGIPWRSLVIDADIPNLDLMLAGKVAANPSEMFITPRFTDMLYEARQQYDYVLLDTPPLLSFSESITVASLVDGVIPVVLMGKTHTSGIAHLREVLSELGKPIIGTIVNTRDGIGATHSSYGYYNHYGVDSYGYVQKNRNSRWQRAKGKILGNPV